MINQLQLQLNLKLYNRMDTLNQEKKKKKRSLKKTVLWVSLPLSLDLYKYLIAFTSTASTLLENFSHEVQARTTLSS